MVKAVELLSESSNNQEDDEVEGEDGDDFLDDEHLLKGLKIHAIEGVKCAAHTLQLAVKDYFLNMDSFEIILKARRVVKYLRTPAFRQLIIENSLPQPQLDVPTRWNSTFVMIKKLLCFEKLCEEPCEQGLKLTVSEWNQLKSLVQV